MTSRIEPYRVSGLQHRQSNPKTRCMTTPWRKRFGFSGGLVPGVDVMAYMMHQPVAKWGRAFLERGLIEARFVKPVYDGEMADVTASESNGVLSIEVHSRGELCATGTASLAGIRAALFRLPTTRKSRRWRSASRSMPLPTNSANGSAPRRATGRAKRPRDIWPISGKPIRSTRRRASAIPACCSG